jgi:hypothetical protein
MQGDGNFVGYRGPGSDFKDALWATQTSNAYVNRGERVIMQTDGNLFVLDKNAKPIWSTETFVHSGAYAKM